MTGRQAVLWATIFWVVLAGPSAAQLGAPAERPPSDYAGQQYVDSKGCLFLRAGPKGNETWIPRVTRDGLPICDQPPSGRRVPIAGKDAGADKAANP
jgi:hypothetical protein